MRTIKLIFLALILIGIVILSLANREPVTVNLLPAGMARILDGTMPNAYQIPLFIVSLASIVVGLVIGYILEWLREHRHRRRAKEKAREAASLNREVDRLKRKSGSGDDDVLALLGN